MPASKTVGAAFAAIVQKALPGPNRPPSVRAVLPIFERLALNLDDLFGCPDLAAQRCLSDDRRDDIRRQGQMRRFKLEALVLFLGGEGFDLTPGSAEHIGDVGDAELR